MDEFKKSLIAKTKEALKKEESYKTKSDVEISTDADKYVSAQLRGTNCAWYKYFITYNPATEWTKTKCPVLGLFGGLDTQVPAITNNLATKAALHKGGNENYTSHIFVNANHLFIPAHTGSVSEYATLPKHFVEGFLDTCSSWILEQTK
jgi:dienelactone hydrolase